MDITDFNVSQEIDGDNIRFVMSADISMTIPISAYREVRQEADGSISVMPVYSYKPPRFHKLRNWWIYHFWYEVKTRVRVLFYGLPKDDDYDD